MPAAPQFTQNIIQDVYWKLQVNECCHSAHHTIYISVTLMVKYHNQVEIIKLYWTRANVQFVDFEQYLYLSKYDLYLKINDYHWNTIILKLSKTRSWNHRIHQTCMLPIYINYSLLSKSLESSKNFFNYWKYSLYLIIVCIFIYILYLILSDNLQLVNAYEYV